MPAGIAAGHAPSSKAAIPEGSLPQERRHGGGNRRAGEAASGPRPISPLHPSLPMVFSMLKMWSAHVLASKGNRVLSSSVAQLCPAQAIIAECDLDAFELGDATSPAKPRPGRPDG